MPMACTSAERRAKNAVTITEEEAWHGVPGECIPELLGGPFGRRMSGHIDVDDAPPVMGKHQEDIQDLETDRRHGEEIHSDMSLRWFSRNLRHVCDGGSDAAPCTC